MIYIFETDVQYDRASHGDKSRVYAVFFVGILIILIACINFINLNTARINDKLKEISISKILGSGRVPLLLRNILESLAICCISVIIGFTLSEVLLPYFNQYLGLDLSINLTIFEIIGTAILFIILLVLVAGLYPAIRLASINPLNIIAKRKEKASKLSSVFQNSLVIFQFFCSISIMIATGIIWLQLNYVSNQPLGFESSNVMLVRNDNPAIQKSINLFIERVENIPGVSQVSGMIGEPGGFHDTMNFKVEGLDETVQMRTAFADEGYTKLFNLELLSGRFYFQDSKKDQEESLVLNETAVTFLGENSSSILGKRIQNLYTDTIFRTVIGVVKDYHFSSLKSKLEPLTIAPTEDFYKVGVKFKASEVERISEEMEEIYSELAAGYPFSYQFLDKKLADLYISETRLKNILLIFTIVCLIISSLGIFGLSINTIKDKIKELSIRKVLGAPGIQLFLYFIKKIPSFNNYWRFISHTISILSFR